MSYLIGVDYVAPKKPDNSMSKPHETAIIAAIKAFCPKDAKKSYEEIVKEMQKSYNYTNDQIIGVIEKVKAEADYTKPVEAPMEP